MVGLQAALQLYMANFFWELDDQAKLLLLMATPVGFFAGIVITRPIHERFDKRRTMIVGASLYYAFAVGPIVLRLMEWVSQTESRSVGCRDPATALVESPVSCSLKSRHDFLGGPAPGVYL